MDNVETAVSSVNCEGIPSNTLSFAAKIGDNVTEFLFIKFQNQDLLLITQFYKIATLYKVDIDNPNTDLNITETVYSVTHISGSENPEAFGAIRFLAEKLNLKKTTHIFFDLKNYEKPNVLRVVEALSKRIS